MSDQKENLVALIVSLDFKKIGRETNSYRDPSAEKVKSQMYLETLVRIKVGSKIHFLIFYRRTRTRLASFILMLTHLNPLSMS
jgi:hypothetical protein